MSTSSIEEKIIQRQLSKEGLTSIVDNKEQVNTFSSKELKTLFRRRKGTRSDTHDTLRCTRCKGMVELGAHSEATIPPAVIDRCVTFLNQYTSYIEGEATALAIPPRDLSDIISICDELRQGAFSTLPEFSRKLRNIIRGVSDVEADCGLTFNIYEEFVARWTELVPELSSLASSSAAGTDENDDDNEGEECVEQDGCPEEEDFNRFVEL